MNKHFWQRIYNREKSLISLTPRKVKKEKESIVCYFHA